MKKNILNIEVTRPNQELIIMSGISGSGKSTKAKELADGNSVIHSTDDVIESMGDYNEFFAKMIASKNFAPLSRAHSINLKNALESIKNGVGKVIIDNTNLTHSEPKAYVEGALRLGLSDSNIKFVDVGTGGLSAEELAKRNSHGVPLEKIKQMMDKYKSRGEMNLKSVMGSKDMYKESNVLYSCVLLDTASRTKLLSMVGGDIPDGWKVIAHHMTIKLGELKDKSDVGKNVVLTVSKLGLSDMAMAVGVSGYETTNKIAHITIAVNVEGGGKPVQSNDITKWQDIKSFMVSGIVTEIKRN